MHKLVHEIACVHTTGHLREGLRDVLLRRGHHDISFRASNDFGANTCGTPCRDIDVETSKLVRKTPCDEIPSNLRRSVGTDSWDGCEGSHGRSESDGGSFATLFKAFPESLHDLMSKEHIGIDVASGDIVDVLRCLIQKVRQFAAHHAYVVY